MAKAKTIFEIDSDAEARAIAEAEADAAAGRVVPHEEVVKWLSHRARLTSCLPKQSVDAGRLDFCGTGLRLGDSPVHRKLQSLCRAGHVRADHRGGQSSRQFSLSRPSGSRHAVARDHAGPPLRHPLPDRAEPRRDPARPARRTSSNTTLNEFSGWTKR